MRVRLIAGAAVALLSAIAPGPAAINQAPMKIVTTSRGVRGVQRPQGAERPRSTGSARERARDTVAPRPPEPPAHLPQLAAEPSVGPVALPAGAQPDVRGVVRKIHILRSSASGSSSPSNSQPCPSPSTCSAHQVRSARWPTDGTGRVVISFAYSDDGRRPARASDGIARPALSAAMSEWMRWNSNIAFRDTGTTNATFGADGDNGTCDDGTNVITWERFPPDVIGAAVVCYDSSGRVITDADLALNATQHWERVTAEPSSRHGHDIQSIYTHELGHWLSLEDLYSSDARRQTMYGDTNYGETNKRTVALGDITGVQQAYPCGSGDRCPRSGIVDD